MKLSQRFSAIAVSVIAAIALTTAAASAQTTQNYCTPAEYKLVYAETEYSHHSHKHLDVACPYNYVAIACGFDIGSDNTQENYHNQDRYFIAINDASPYHFDSSHSDYQYQGEYGCHFRANNFAAYFPGYQMFYWNIKGTATCVPKDCASEEKTSDYYQESLDAMLSWDWQ
jgi:hypothetical protein